MYQAYGELRNIAEGMDESVRSQYSGVLAIGAAIESSKKLKTRNKVDSVRRAFLSQDIGGEQAYMAIAALDDHLNSASMRRSDNKYLRDQLKSVRDEAVRHYRLEENKLGAGFESYVKDFVSQSPLFEKVEDKSHFEKMTERNLAYVEMSPVGRWDSGRMSLVHNVKVAEVSLESKVATPTKKERLSGFVKPLANIAAVLTLGVTGIMQSSCISSAESNPIRTYMRGSIAASDSFGPSIMPSELRSQMTAYKEVKTDKNAPVIQSVDNVAEVKTSATIQTSPATTRLETMLDDEFTSIGVINHENERLEIEMINQRRDMGKRIYEGLQNGMNKLRDVVRGFDAKLFSIVPSSPVASVVSYEASIPSINAEPVVRIPENTIIESPMIHSGKKECGTITMARQLGLTGNDGTKKILSLGAGDNLGRDIYVQDKIIEARANEDSMRNISAGSYGNDSKELSRRAKTVLIKNYNGSESLIPLAGELVIGTSGIRSSENSQISASVWDDTRKTNLNSQGFYAAPRPSDRAEQVGEFDEWFAGLSSKSKVENVAAVETSTKGDDIWVHGVMASENPTLREEQKKAFNNWLAKRVARENAQRAGN